MRNSSRVSENDASDVRITGNSGSTGKLDRGAYTEPERENRTHRENMCSAKEDKDTRPVEIAWNCIIHYFSVRLGL